MHQGGSMDQNERCHYVQLPLEDKWKNPIQHPLGDCISGRCFYGLEVPVADIRKKIGHF